MKILRYFSVVEWIMWLGGTAAIVVSFFACGNSEYAYLFGSLLGATMLIFVSKGNPIGQVLTVVFSVFYGWVSYGLRYYGEMITYLGMTTPIAIAAVVTWLKNPYRGNRAEVTVNSLKKKEYFIVFIVGMGVSVGFYFVLKALGTANLIASTVSVLTSFLAVYLTARRSAYYALAYAANDIVLIVLWSMAAAVSTEYISIVVCFAVFLVNDIYGLLNWRAIQRRQSRG